ncbi:polyprenyl synthetase family protein [Leptospira idonii]|uniref:Polyprenyl synthetase family protein n=1 Tax=Leptospira idonii TaxID=1193500 RepID=A0A4R9M2P6_9LEPT|nr:polyprenyl synthetase family protein [Leptospira idonii]TGN20392.1 polyprenyl synthetase family protein [Leptospira idonii]
MNSFSDSIDSARSVFDPFFLPFLTETFYKYGLSRASEAALYSLRAGGKRIRPVISINSYYANEKITKDESSITLKNLLILSSSIECIHTYSLIHDDLPSMDDDDFRRGKPTCHKEFDVPTAILAGDALNSLGFYLIGLIETEDPKVLRDLLSYLHQGAGVPGMITGQMEDLEEEGKAGLSSHRKNISSAEKLISIHEKKTGALIHSSFLMGNRLREDYAERETVLSEYAKEIGLLFQITDDILDVEGSKESLGKTPGKDADSGKLTYPGLYGMEKAKQIRDDSRDKALGLAESLESNQFHFFKGLPKYIAERKN